MTLAIFYEWNWRQQNVWKYHRWKEAPWFREEANKERMNAGSGWKWLINPVHWNWVLFLMESSKLTIIVSCRVNAMILCHKINLKRACRLKKTLTKYFIWNSQLPSFLTFVCLSLNCIYTQLAAAEVIWGLQWGEIYNVKLSEEYKQS